MQSRELGYMYISLYDSTLVSNVVRSVKRKMGKEGIGDVYVDQKTAKQYIPMRFVNNSLTLQRIKIAVVSHSVVVGRQGNQTYPIASAGTLIMTNIDLADLYFKGVSGDAVVNIIGTTRD